MPAHCIGWHFVRANHPDGAHEKHRLDRLSPPSLTFSSFVGFLTGPWTVTRSFLHVVCQGIAACWAMGLVRFASVACEWGPAVGLWASVGAVGVFSFKWCPDTRFPSLVLRATPTVCGSPLRYWSSICQPLPPGGVFGAACALWLVVCLVPPVHFGWWCVWCRLCTLAGGVFGAACALWLVLRVSRSSVPHTPVIPPGRPVFLSIGKPGVPRHGPRVSPLGPSPVRDRTLRGPGLSSPPPHPPPPTPGLSLAPDLTATDSWSWPLKPCTFGGRPLAPAAH